MVDYIESVLMDDLYDTPRALIYDLLRQHKIKSFEQIRSNKKRKQIIKNNKKFLRLPAVLEQVGYKSSTIYEMIKEGSFPAPVHLGPRLTAWVESEVQQWMQDRIDERDEKEA